MAVSRRFPKGAGERSITAVDEDNDEKSKQTGLSTKSGYIAILVIIFIVVVQPGRIQSEGATGNSRSGSTSNIVLKGSHGKGKKQEYELYPFLVDAKALDSLGTPSDEVISKPTLPEFPVISKLEGCKVSYKPNNPPRTIDSEWRTKFWIPSFPGSGASNPTKKGDIVKAIIEGLFSGETANDREGHFHPIKDYHMSIGKKKLKRCKGISETVGCTCSHPQTKVNPELQTSEFRPGAILSIRNPATAIPMFFTYKNIAYHKGTKQVPEEEWRNMRDSFFDGTLNDWMNVIEFWRGTSSSYYSTAIYVPFEDLVTTDPSKGSAKIRELSDTISGRNSRDIGGDGNHFETTSSEQDYECLWYQTAKKEWEREQQIIGDYIPAYTQLQKDKMIRYLNSFADNIEKDDTTKDQDDALVSLLRRYANQIEAYVRVEEQQAPQR